MNALSAMAIAEALLEWSDEQRQKLITQLQGEGYKLVDELDTGEYTLALWKGSKERDGQPVQFYEMSLNFKDFEFTDAASQAGHRGGSIAGVGVRRQMLQRVAKWINSIGTVYVGSFDDRKLKFYLNMFQRYFNGYRISQPFVAFDDSVKPDYFTVSR